MSCWLVFGSPPHAWPTLFLLWSSAVFQPTALQLISTTHLPAPPGSRNCYGLWPAPTEASRCSSRSPACPHTGRSYSWLGSHTRSRLQGGRSVVQNLGIVNSAPLKNCSRSPGLVSVLTHLLPWPLHTSSCCSQESRGSCSCSRRSLRCWRSGRWCIATRRGIRSHLAGRRRKED